MSVSGPTEDYTYEFYARRGLTEASFRHYGCKTKIDREGEPVSVGYTYPNGAIKVRDLKKKGFHWKGEYKPSLYGKDKFASGSSKFVTITEGEEDAHSLFQVLHSPCVSVSSSGAAVGDCVAEREWLSGFDRIYLCFDNDAAGRTALRNVAKLFDYNKVYVVKLTNRKDANEYLQHGEADVLRQVWWNAKKYQPENIISAMDDFKTILADETTKGVPYPWPTLTKMTYGVRTGETVLIMAPEKVGKTTLMHHIEHHLLKETDSNVGSIFLEEPKKRHLENLIGLELRQPIHLPDHAVEETIKLDTLSQVLRRDDRLYLYNHFGSDSPEILLDTIRFLVSACACRYILLDHITIAVSGLVGDDERRAIDHLCTRLEMMVKELNFALIMVSHVNDDGKSRGSRYPTKVSDITITLSRDGMHSDLLQRNVLTLSVPYNRFCSNTGYAGSLLFDTTTYTYTEIAKEDQHGLSCEKIPLPSNDNSPDFKGESLVA